MNAKSKQQLIRAGEEAAIAALPAIREILNKRRGEKLQDRSSSLH
jgi:hypothetical protein